MDSLEAPHVLKTAALSRHFPEVCSFFRGLLEKWWKRKRQFGLFCLSCWQKAVHWCTLSKTYNVGLFQEQQQLISTPHKEFLFQQERDLRGCLQGKGSVCRNCLQCPCSAGPQRQETAAISIVPSLVQKVAASGVSRGLKKVV